ncbi:MAG: hypothetical protein H6738_03430 [Alphaproteobacteria bacterium]|nr:hypothetical protein [Alphaproteobacteria bacterium]
MTKERTFGWMVGGAVLLLGLLQPTVARWPLLVVGALLLLLGTLAPATLAGPRRAWMALGRALDGIVSPVVLRVLYYGLITPFSLLAPRAHRAPGWHEPAEPDGWWLLALAPMLLVLALVGGLLLLSEGSVLAPFLYPLF